MQITRARLEYPPEMTVSEENMFIAGKRNNTSSQWPTGLLGLEAEGEEKRVVGDLPAASRAQRRVSWFQLG